MNTNVSSLPNPALEAAVFLYQQGRFSEALELFYTLADDHPDANCWLGLLFFRGEGVAANPTQAAEHFRKAAEGKSTNGCFYYGCLFMQGDGVPRNPAKATYWLTEADRLGHTDAAKMLSQIWESKKIDGLESDDSKRTILKTVNDRLADITGLKPLHGFDLKNLFSEAFRKHSLEEIEEFFINGTKSTTPSFTSVQGDWPKPWAFLPILILSVLVYVGFSYAIDRFDNSKLIPGWLFIGTFGVPFATLVMIYELNILRNISAYMVGKLLLMGGILSLVLTLFLSEFTKLHEAWGASSAGVIEELAKLMVVIILAKNVKYPWTLNGIVLGATVGTAFAAFESAGYAFDVLLETFSIDSAASLIYLRGMLSPLGHTCWTAITAGALWRVLEGRKFTFEVLMDWRFLRIALIPVVLHMIWNSPLKFTFLGDPWSVFAKWVVLGVVAWSVLFMLMQDGLSQIKQSRSGRLG